MRRHAFGSLGAQPVSLFDTEPMLLVDDHHAEPVEVHSLLQQRVGADDDACLTGGNFVAHLPFLLG